MLDDLKRWVIAKEIFKTKNEKMLTFPKLASYIKFSRTDPVFCDVINYLVKNEAIYIENIIGKTQIITLNHRNIKKLLDQGYVYNTVAEYVRIRTRGFYAGI